LRNYAKAKADLQEAVKLSPDDIKIHNDLVAVYKALGDKNGVAEEGEKIKSLNRDY
jgi:Flp pilus assembly protein TadD